MLEFEDKKILVTGASRGIGRAVATAFAAHGGKVAVNYRQGEKSALETLDGLDGDGHVTVQADVSLADGAKAAVDESIAGLNGLDIVVNNAGIFREHRLDSVDFDKWQSSWQKTIGVNLVGPANLCYFAAQHMIRSGGGRIVNVSSRASFRGEPKSPAYAASKAGLNAMSQSLAKRLGPYGISVGVVAPGFVDTDMAAPFLEGSGGDAIRNQSTLGRIARPEEVAAAVIFLCRKETEFLTGAIIDVNGASYLRS